MTRKNNLYQIRDFSLAIKINALFPIQAIEVASKENKVLFSFTYNRKFIKALASNESGLLNISPNEYEKSLKLLSQYLQDMV